MSLIVLFGAVATIDLGILIMGGQWMQRAVIANLFGLAFGAGAALAVGLLNAVSGWVWSSWALPWMLGSSFLALMDMGYRYLGIRPKQARPVDQANEPSGALQELLAHARSRRLCDNFFPHGYWQV